MSRKARQFQDVGRCRSCQEWRKVNTAHVCLPCSILVTGDVRVSSSRPGEDDEDDRQPQRYKVDLS